jgi:hypothetical protein
MEPTVFFVAAGVFSFKNGPANRMTAWKDTMQLTVHEDEPTGSLLYFSRATGESCLAASNVVLYI